MDGRSRVVRRLFSYFIPRMLLPSHRAAAKTIKSLRLINSTHRCARPFVRFFAIMSNRTYEDAVDLLNTLQTPFEILKQRRDAGIRIDKTANDEMRKCLTQIGYTQSELSKLNIVHVAGTKGKGSTCAYVDSILSQHHKSYGVPRKTGLFTSPHLIAVRERIRINQTPISKIQFAKYFFEVWDALKGIDKPVYFRYLTLMSYHVFFREGVDAAIYEVGVGGEYDSTNIVDTPAVTGISSLGIDHTYTLGETIEEIAWHKAGIQKSSCMSITVTQPASALKVVENRAKEKQVKALKVVGQDERLKGVAIRPDAAFQKLNASLAISLAETVLVKLDPTFRVSMDTLPNEFRKGLENVVWRGRCEKKIEGNITWYLDGAHTTDSIVVASRWFGAECSQKPGKKILIFNQQGHREAIALLKVLYQAITYQSLVKFDCVLFCPVSTQTDSTSKKDFVNRMYDTKEIAGLTLQKAFAKEWRELDSSLETSIKVLPSVEDALEQVRQFDEPGLGDSGGVHVFITGSVHLVGRSLGSLEGVDAV